MTRYKRTPGSQTSLREANRNRLIDAVRKHGGLTQVELAGETGLSPATISNIVKELTAAEVLSTRPSTRSGRRATYVTLAHAAGLVVGIHFSAQHLRIVVTDVNNTLLAEQHMPLARNHRSDNEMDRAALLLADMLGGLDSNLDEVLGVGVAVPAPVRRDSGLLVRNGILDGWSSNLDVRQAVHGRLRRPVFVENSSNMAALAETRVGAARGRSHVAFLSVDHGVGAGLVLGGEVFRGQRGLAGEVGHTVIDEGGPVCRCGNRGCVEALAGGSALLTRLEPDLGTLKLRDIVVRAMEGEPTVVRALGEAGSHLGIAVANLCNLFDPERVVVGGDLALVGELLLGPLRHEMERSILGGLDFAPEVVQAQLSQKGPALGAAIFALDQSAAHAVAV